MIRNFRDKRSELVFAGLKPKEFSLDLVRVARRRLQMLDNAPSLVSLRTPPGNRLEALKADRVGQYSIRINDQFRICFGWLDGDAIDVEIVDYH